MPLYRVWVQLRLKVDPGSEVKFRWHKIGLNAPEASGMDIYLEVGRAEWLPRRGDPFTMFYHERCQGNPPWPRTANLQLEDRVRHGTELVLIHEPQQGVSFVEEDEYMGGPRGAIAVQSEAASRKPSPFLEH